ncbi:PLP-dependent aminotransferase family protein [Niallia taxi]|uniref:aminotransferase-like domain-containing protein n=1 Tax=Niallia taxi TaxID=2499688 RepID=UPI002E1AF966|nr:PLP-dependent aminotransferase family protein [Niallia taxi]MED4052541.1 PLP-dependent aminotransferase family protein [Niallia taxi]MED4119896.1 PLP-dependent aminotransferase family protein [Niallia taxi]
MNSMKKITFSKRFPDMPIIGSSFAGSLDHVIPLSYGFPAPESFPLDTMVTATERAMKTQGSGAMSYTGGSGISNIVNWILKRSELREVYANKDQIIVTSGSMQAIDLVARTLTDPGDEIWIEAPCFFGAIRTFNLAQVNLRSFPIDENGIIVEHVERALIEATLQQKPLPKILYIMPNYHNPGGVNLSVDRRKKLADLAYEYNFIILEDDAYVELSFDGTYLPSIHSFGPDRVIYLSTFSKVIAPGIRLGWAIGLSEIISKMRILKTDGLTSVYVQEVAYNVLEQLDIESHINNLSTMYKTRKEAMVAAIKEHFGDEVSFVSPEGGFFLWVTFPQGVNTSAFVDDAMTAGVSYLDGRHFFLEEEGYNTMRLCFTYCNEEKIKEAIKRLAEIYYQHLRSLPMEEAN